MLDEILGVAFVRVVAFVFRIVLFPVALLICTPFILIRAAILAARHRAKFTHAVADGYSSVDVFWWT
jgi:hypothetical protein